MSEAAGLAEAVLYLAELARERKVSPENARKDLLCRSVFSVSGLRLIVSGDKQDLSVRPPREAVEFALAAAAVHGAMLKDSSRRPEIILGMDTRPTGPVLLCAAAMMYGALGLRVRCAGAVPLPQVMAATHQGGLSGFCYFTASHNPAGHNGIKLGLSDGAVLAAGSAKTLIDEVRRLLMSGEELRLLWERIGWGALAPAGFDASMVERAAKESRRLYRDFLLRSLSGVSMPLDEELRRCFSKRRVKMVYDMNGSSRLFGPDLEMLRDFGVELLILGGEPGVFPHAIVPEGKSLEPCRALVQELIGKGEEVVAGIAVDCDGDRGNLVIPASGRAVLLPAQDTFALAVIAEISARRAGTLGGRTAVAANDPTSLRLDRLLRPFGVQVFRAEVGEANVLALARELSGRGCAVPISGEGSNGGNITSPSTVRDPMMTVLSMLRFIARGLAPKCVEKISGRPGRPDSGLAELLAVFPAWRTTDAFEPEALMRLPELDQDGLKSRYEALLQEHFRVRRDFWKRAGIDALDFVNYEGAKAIPGPGNRTPPARGSLSVVLRSGNEDLGFMCMRASGTEPVFRVLVDWGGAPEIYPELLALHREMIGKAVTERQ